MVWSSATTVDKYREAESLFTTGTSSVATAAIRDAFFGARRRVNLACRPPCSRRRPVSALICSRFRRDGLIRLGFGAAQLSYVCTH